MDLGATEATGRGPVPARVALRAGIHFYEPRTNQEECESGRIGTIGNRVKGNLPWVQIPPPPPTKGYLPFKPKLLTELREIGTTTTVVRGLTT